MSDPDQKTARPSGEPAPIKRASGTRKGKPELPPVVLVDVTGDAGRSVTIFGTGIPGKRRPR